MKKNFIIGLALLLLIPGLIMLSQAEKTHAQEQANELKVAIHADENTLTPYTYVRGYPGMEVLRWIYDSIFLLNLENEPVPWMAVDYSVDEDYKVYHIELHDDLKWHDGKEVTAEDIKFSFRYALEQDRARWISTAAQIADIEIKGDLELTITLEDPNPDFIREGLADFPIIPEHIYRDEENAAEVPVTIGSGPYELKEYQAGQFYRLEAVEDYFMGTPKVSNIIMPIMTDTSSIFQALRAEQLDATTAQLAPELVPNFERDERLKVITGAGFSSTLLQFNTEEYPFNIKEFRQAVAYALDTEEILEIVLLGYGDRGSLGFYHPELPWAEDDLLPERDLEKSRELLDELEFNVQDRQGIRLDADDNPLQFELLVYADNPLRIRAAELISDQLQEIDIKVDVKSLEAGTVDDLVWPEFDVSQGRNYQMTMWGWSAPVQTRTDSLIDLMASQSEVGTLNIGGFQSQEFDSLAAEFKTTLDSEARQELVKEMQLTAAEEVPFITLYYNQIIAAFNDSVYDGWTMQEGVGIINKFSLLPVEGEETEPLEETEEEEAEEGAASWLWIIIPAAAIVIIAAGIRKRKNA